ncbi:hypothetical protein K474DRAFT_1655699 [Panus rudis PR-1116 ss-1]|nr:hypothetical protein K474DRAFT_1655699 [Panus rudis PR-1116 ss-1]
MTSPPAHPPLFSNSSGLARCSLQWCSSLLILVAARPLLRPLAAAPGTQSFPAEPRHSECDSAQHWDRQRACPPPHGLGRHGHRTEPKPLCRDIDPSTCRLPKCRYTR